MTIAIRVRQRMRTVTRVHFGGYVQKMSLYMYLYICIYTHKDTDTRTYIYIYLYTYIHIVMHKPSNSKLAGSQILEF